MLMQYSRCGCTRDKYSTRHKNCITCDNFTTFPSLAKGRPGLIFMLLFIHIVRFVHLVQVSVLKNAPSLHLIICDFLPKANFSSFLHFYKVSSKSLGDFFYRSGVNFENLANCIRNKFYFYDFSI